MADVYNSRLSIQGAGEAVVLVPGINGTEHLFYRQVPSLAQSYRVATYALRDDASSMSVLTDDLSQMVETVAPVERRAIIVGESFGGAVALSFALAHPERVAALVVLNSFPYFASQIRLRLALVGLTALPWRAMGFARRATAFRLHSRQTPRTELNQFLRLTARATRQGYLNRLKLLTRYDVRPHLGDIRSPTLFLAAEEDHLVPSVAHARYMAERLPGAMLRILNGHGHTCLIAPGIDLAQILAEWRGRAVASESFPGRIQEAIGPV